MLRKILFVVSALTLVRAQIPSLGYCPDYAPMPGFDMSKFLGVWYEAERYFQITEVVSRCVTANYTKGEDNKLRVSNEVTNRLTGIKRILEGEIKTSGKKTELGKLHVKYTVPFTPETQYAVLDTDYKNYAVLWSCSGIGPINAQNAWLMTRVRQPAGEVLQQAYGVLDKYKISKTFFVKTDQEDCAYLAAATPVKPVTAQPEPAKPAEETPNLVVEESNESETVEEAQQAKSAIKLRSAIVPDAPAIIIETRKAELEAEAKKPSSEASIAADAEVQPGTQSGIQPEPEAEIEANPKIEKRQPVVVLPENNEEKINSVEQVVEAAAPPTSVPEVILKTADLAKEKEKEPAQDPKQFQLSTIIQEALANPGAQFQEAIAKPVSQFQGALADRVESFQDAIKKPVQQLQNTFSKPLAQFQEAFASPLANFQQVFNRPAASASPEASPETQSDPAPETTAAATPEEAPVKVKAAIQEPVEIIKEASNAVTDAAPEKLAEEIKEKEEVPEEEKKEEEEKKIES